MKNFICICFFLLNYSSSNSLYAKSEENTFKTINTLLSSHLDSAYILSQEWLEEATEANDYFGIVKGNLLLGYISAKKENRGKAVIYLLEGIRQAEKATYVGVGLDKIRLRRNIANTFRKFEANKLATRYNLEAIKLAEEQGKTNQIIKIKLNQAIVYKKDDKHDLAIQLLTEILPLIEDDPFRQSEIINEIGTVYLEQEKYLLSKNYFEQVLTLPTDKTIFKIKALNNLGKVSYELGNKERALDYLTQAIDLASENDQNKYNLFMVYQKKGDYLFAMSRKKEALTYLMKAEELAHVATWNSHSLEIYKTFSTLYYSEGNMELGKQYSDTYFTKIQSYIEKQEDLQKKETEFNFELITKKYFDEVEKQEQIASIISYFWIMFGSLLFILLFTIGYNRYKKIQLRKSIRQGLIDFKMIDVLDVK